MDNICIEGPLPAPAILHVHFESRAFALQLYILTPVPRPHGPLTLDNERRTVIAFVYLNMALDVFLFYDDLYKFYFETNYELILAGWERHIKMDRWLETLKRKPGFRVELTTAPEEFWKIVQERADQAYFD